MTILEKKHIENFDPRNLPIGFIDNPYRWYNALRTHDPVHRCPDGSWFLTRHEDLCTVYKSPQLYSSDKKIEFGEKYGPSPLLEHHTTSLVFNDPPLHTRVRRLLMGALSNRAIDGLEPGLIILIDKLLDSLEDSDQPDLVTDYACAIPVEVIGNLLAIPHEDREPLREWSLNILGALEPVLTQEQERAGNQSVKDFSTYLEELIHLRTLSPLDPDKDVLTRLIKGEGSDEKLSLIELVHNCIFILNAGHETTTNLIANSLYLLTQWPDQKRMLLNEPGIIRTAVDEFLRFESSNQLGNRMSTEASLVGDVRLPPSSRITLCIGAANRDPEVFSYPNMLDLKRKPNRHLAFGTGPHLCAGVSLARLEGRIAIERFLKRFPNYRLNGAPERSKRVRFRGFVSLPVEL